MNYRAESINTALEYLEEARRELAKREPFTKMADLLIGQALTRLRRDLDIRPSEASIEEVVKANTEAA